VTRDIGATDAVGSRAAIVGGGLSLIGGAIGFLVVFTYLAVNFNYPEILDGQSDVVLPALLATGSNGRAAWAIYSVLPLIWIPAGVGVFEALRARAQAVTRLGLAFAIVAALSMMLGLMRWPSIHWELANAWGLAGESERATLAVVFDGLNRYLGNFVGEFLGELACNLFFLCTAIGLLQHRHRALGWAGLVTGILGLVGMWRNVTAAVALVSDINNYLLPLWMLASGTWLLVVAGRARKSGS
jgi:hypothetical protein